MATHSSILAWEIPWTEESGWLQSMGLQRVRNDLATKQQQHEVWDGGDVIGKEGDVGRNMGDRRRHSEKAAKVDGEEAALLGWRDCPWK